MTALRLEGIRHPLLAPIDLKVAAGELAFISGPSGSGKSLLLRAIADLDPHEGNVWLGDEARSAMAPPTWRRRVGLLPAESFWWGETVGEHLLSRKQTAPETDPSIDTWLGQLGFTSDVLTWSVARLSTGERQRLALIRLLAQGPEAMLLDEATANLDPANRDCVESVIEAYRRQAQAAVLWVSHDPEQRRRLGGPCYLIDAGKLVPEP
ncbi:ABC transporter ATP-binding protein [Thiocystis violacea]|uniref:ABC transporter ATP-binding protein n=1 Tax=Thiocystis violacea TaxID=13725 RepID=UPI00190413E5|nr:ATP-binding cassette domain-containing protein [Thiocystis violacea]MBK1722132.1 ATP-binding protein [Thiocystis violacea]